MSCSKLFIWKLLAILLNTVYHSGGSPELSVPDLILRHGYPVETHKVRTDDGYLLIVHRIPYTRDCKKDVKRRQPILLTHGFVSSSVVWVIAGPGKGLAFDLVNANYDVWLGNFRGNTYSSYHETLSDSDFKFWDFSWDEMAEYDLPAMIDYIYNVKSKEDNATLDRDLLYAGHSMGGTVYLATMATKLEYNVKVRAAILLAPVVYLAGIDTWLAPLAPLGKLIQAVIRSFGRDDFLSQKMLKKLSPSFLQLVMRNTHLLYHMLAEKKPHYDKKMMAEISAFLPAGTSTRTAYHGFQLIASKGKFQKYDYGPRENLLKYGQQQPPLYNLSVITSPIDVFQSKADYWIRTINTERMLSELTASTTRLFKVTANKFGHNEFNLGRRAAELVNRPIMRMMKDFR